MLTGTATDAAASAAARCGRARGGTPAGAGLSPGVGLSAGAGLLAGMGLPAGAGLTAGVGLTVETQGCVAAMSLESLCNFALFSLHSLASSILAVESMGSISLCIRFTFMQSLFGLFRVNTSTP